MVLRGEDNLLEIHGTPFEGDEPLLMTPSSSGHDSEAFRIDVLPAGDDVVHVRPVGELDIATVGRLDDRLRELREAGYKRFVLDLRGLVFIDSTGLRLILELDSFARRDGIDLSLVSGPPAVHRVFEVSGIVGLLPFRSA